ncbi:pyridoxal phosphate-dependent decarboxylase family protein [Sandarakinorhabdus rubra]|uniref:pyridoxal phosphate-dependent decarboxylase family protein n=1 Tax=Sandarakinorhabdus rubra TaxID=2672568 RepID=UPI0013D92B1B|nr:pyridoxal-dependent decarboxylase [Sandarakinorhabdus rubra]
MSQDPLDIAIAEGRRFIDSLAHRSVGPTGSRADILAPLPTHLPEHGMDPADVVRTIARAAEPGLNANMSSRFFAWVNGGSLPAAQATDVLTSLWDQNAVLAATSPASAVLEEVAAKLLLEALHLPPTCAVSFTTGCQMSHAAALAAARHHVLAKATRDGAGWDVERDGLFGAPPIRVLANAHHHGSVTRALRLLGFGTACVVPLAGGAPGRVGAAELQAALTQAPGAPTIVILNAGDLNLGQSDDFATLIPLAQAAGAWVHVDGAFGLWLAASPRYADQVAGIQLADSIASDGHKWLNTPYDCGMAITRHGEALKASMKLTASYLSQDGDTRDPMNYTPEWSRRARSLPVLAALMELGRDGLADLIARCCDHALALHDGLAALPGATSIARPIMNQGMVRFHAADGTNITDAVIAAINASGEAFFSGTLWQGERTMRISVCNWQTNADDVRRTVAAAAEALASLR